LRELLERYHWKRERLKGLFFRLAVYSFGVYLLVYLVQALGLYPVESILRLETLGTVVLVLTTLSLSIYVDSGQLSSTTTRGIQAVFLVSLVALTAAYASIPSLSGVSALLNEYAPKLVNLSVATGVLSVVFIRANEGRARFFPGRQFPKLSSRTDVLTRTRVAGLLVPTILAYFVRLRSPFLRKTFGGVPHSDKYAFHVPVLQWMYRTADPFYFRNEGYISLFTPDKYAFDQFWNAPIFSWNALPVMFVDGPFEIEFIVRSTVTIQGIVLLVVLFLLFRELFDVELALLGTLLLAVNELFNLVTFLTVMDVPALVFTFTSILLYLWDKKTYSYLLCGCAALTKYSFLLITVPALGVLILSNESEKFYNVVKLAYLTLLPIVLFHFLVLPAAGDSLLLGSIRLLAFVASLLLSLFAFERYETTFVDTASRIESHARYAMILFGPLFGVVFFWDEIGRYAPEFLTDEHLLFNVDMYLILVDRTRELHPDAMFYVFPVGLLWFLLEDDRRKRTTIVALLVAAVIYGVVASKSIFFHAYYKHVFVIVSIVGFLGVLDVVRHLDLPTKVTTPAASLLVVLLVVSSQSMVTDTFGSSISGTEEMSEYLDVNVSDSERILRTSQMASLLAIYSDVGIVGSSVPNSISDAQIQAMKSDVESNGLGCALLERNVTRYLSLGPGQFERLEHLLTLNDRTTSGRRNAILRETNPSYQSPLRDNGVSPPSQYFELETRIGDWYLYEIQSGGEDGTCPKASG
jgi:hypothetical protein